MHNSLSSKIQILIFSRSIFVIVLLLLFDSCNLKNRNEKYTNNIIVQVEEPAVKNQYAWIDSFPQKIKSLRDSFYCYDLGKNFRCALIDDFFSNFGTRVVTTGLTKIDSTLSKLFFENSISENDVLRSSYLYSIERPFMDFYPITVINPNPVVERPLTLILFDHNGKYLNSIEVADSYGETGGCLESSFINDSVMVQKFRWDEYDIDSLGNDVFTSSFHTQKVVFNRNGTYKIIEAMDSIN